MIENSSVSGGGGELKSSGSKPFVIDQIFFSGYRRASRLAHGSETVTSPSACLRVRFSSPICSSLELRSPRFWVQRSRRSAIHGHPRIFFASRPIKCDEIGGEVVTIASMSIFWRRISCIAASAKGVQPLVGSGYERIYFAKSSVRVWME